MRLVISIACIETLVLSNLNYKFIETLREALKMQTQSKHIPLERLQPPVELWNTYPNSIRVLSAKF